MYMVLLNFEEAQLEYKCTVGSSFDIRENLVLILRGITKHQWALIKNFGISHLMSKRGFTWGKFSWKWGSRSWTMFFTYRINLMRECWISGVNHCGHWWEWMRIFGMYMSQALVITSFNSFQAMLTSFDSKRDQLNPV